MSRDNTRVINPEDYHCYKSGAPECPVCLVDCADSSHFTTCWIGQKIGEATRPTAEQEQSAQDYDRRQANTPKRIWEL